jgi:internalin A
MSELAQQLIEREKVLRTGYLDLGNCGLTELPDLSELEWLEALVVSNKWWDWEERKWVFSKNKGKTNSIGYPPARFLPEDLRHLIWDGDSDQTLSVPNWEFLEKLTNLTSLNLSFNQISDGSFLEKLTNLTALYLGWNQIRDGSFLDKLTKIKKLGLSNNQITDVRFLARMTKLIYLDLSNNQITDVRFLARMTKLIYLDLSNNQIRNSVILKKLANLTFLDLSGNKISRIFFPDRLPALAFLNLKNNQINEIHLPESLPNITLLTLSENRLDKVLLPKELPNLISLHLRNNRISEALLLGYLPRLESLYLAGNQLREVVISDNLPNLTLFDLGSNEISDISFLLPLIKKGIEVIDYPHYSTIEGLWLYGNPITNPPLEIVEKGNAAILEYFRQKEATGAELLLEAKLILLGDGRAGKTSLANRLLGKDLPTEADRTHGVDIIIGEYEFPVAGGGTFQLNIWDFAGQDKYKPLHQFFYTESSLYVMVAESGNSGTDYDDWFQTAELFGEGSPLLLALNEFRDGMGLGSFDVELWKKRFPNLLKEVFSVNLGTQRGMEELRQHIHLLAQTLPHTRYESPKNWAAVRRELESRRSEHFISLQEYLRICRDNQLPERDSALILSSVLHKIGVCLHYQKSELLRQYVILNNEWATGAVYQILEDPVVAEEKRGFFDWNDLRRIWHDAAYCDMQPQLLELMQQFKMAYPLPNGKEYVAPPLLSPAPPANWEWPAGESLAMYVEYEFMPKLLMTQFIVSRYMDIAEGRTQVWRNGVVLRWPDALAEVVKSKSQGRDAFLVRVQGKGGKGLLTAILKTLRDLHEEYKGIRPHEIIPCPCSGCRSGKNRQHYFDFRKLQNWWERGTRERDCDESGEFVDIGQLLGDNFLFEKMEIGQPLRMREMESPGALEQQGLEESLLLMIQKLNRILKALAIENDPSAKFKYEKQIETLELEIAEVRGKLRGMNG